jgi:hypothetical protein
VTLSLPGVGTNGKVHSYDPFRRLGSTATSRLSAPLWRETQVKIAFFAFYSEWTHQTRIHEHGDDQEVDEVEVSML